MNRLDEWIDGGECVGPEGFFVQTRHLTNYTHQSMFGQIAA
jgi:hypothetical protein